MESPLLTLTLKLTHFLITSLSLFLYHQALLHGRKIFAMETPIPDPLQCPRCNSSNTKFCYYNNYSLSQPRHFCKACKRYWTRGGTLRNVPVGGGCRRNKKFRRHPPPTKSSTVQLDVDLSSPSLPSSSSNPINNPFFYGLQSGYPHELNFPFSETRVSSNSPRLDPGLGFEQGIRDHADCIGFGSSSSSMASLLASSLQHQSLTPYEDLRMAVGNGGINSNQIIEQNNNTSFLWNSNNVGVWFDSSSSVPSLM